MLEMLTLITLCPALTLLLVFCVTTGVSASDINEVLLVGGMTRMPKVRCQICSETGVCVDLFVSQVVMLSSCVFQVKCVCKVCVMRALLQAQLQGRSTAVQVQHSLLTGVVHGQGSTSALCSCVC